MFDNHLSIFLTVAITHFLALLSPGPDFVLVVKSALKRKTKHALGVAAGIATANAIYIALCLVGVGAILASHVWLMVVLKLIGGVFLIYLGIQALGAKKAAYSQLNQSLDSINNQVPTYFFYEVITGFLSGALNPKNLFFYLSLFTLVLTEDVSFSFKLSLGIWMTFVVLMWDAAIILVLSSKAMRTRLSQIAWYIDKATGAILSIIGISIIRSAVIN